jgi:uncharacterized membrane protein
MTRAVEIGAKLRIVNCNSSAGSNLPFWVLLAVYAIARVLQVYPGRVPMLAVVVLHLIPPAIFAVIHGAKLYGSRGILTFFVIAFLVGNAFENLGVRTGFPFGHYYFTNLMGPKLSVVPITLGLAYVGMAYLSWTLADLILRVPETTLLGRNIVFMPLMAACIMTCWDVSQDAIWSTVLHAWVWLNGGVYFGVPLVNFFGWLLTMYVTYQFFAFYLRGRPTSRRSLSASHWHQAILFYGVSAAGNLMLVLPQNRFLLVTDHAGVQWQVRHITEACAIVTILTMETFTIMAWQRLAKHTGQRTA